MLNLTAPFSLFREIPSEKSCLERNEVQDLSSARFEDEFVKEPGHLKDFSWSIERLVLSDEEFHSCSRGFFYFLPEEIREKNLEQISDRRNEKIRKIIIPKIGSEGKFLVSIPCIKKTNEEEMFLTGRTVDFIVDMPAHSDPKELMKHLICARKTMEYVYRIIKVVSNFPSKFSPCQVPQDVLVSSLEFCRQDGRGYLERIAKCKAWNIGNCGELAFLALDFPTSIRIDLIALDHSDHVFNLVGLPLKAKVEQPSTWGNNALVLDLWSGAIVPAKEWQNYVLGYSTIKKLIHDGRGNSYAPVVFRLKQFCFTNIFPFSNQYVHLACKAVAHHADSWAFNASVNLQNFMNKAALYDSAKILQIIGTDRHDEILRALEILAKKENLLLDLSLLLDEMIKRPDVARAISILYQYDMGEPSILTKETIEAVVNSENLVEEIFKLHGIGEFRFLVWKDFMKSSVEQWNLSKKNDSDFISTSCQLI